MLGENSIFYEEFGWMIILDFEHFEILEIILLLYNAIVLILIYIANVHVDAIEV